LLELLSFAPVFDRVEPSGGIDVQIYGCQKAKVFVFRRSP
jgi:hypothetical protein